MDFSKILETLKKGVDFAEQLTPVLSVIPGAGSIIATVTQAVGAVTDVVTNVSERVAEGSIVATSNDQAELKALVERLQDTNDALAEYIDTH